MISGKIFLLAIFSAYFCFIDVYGLRVLKKQHNTLDVVSVLIFFPNVILKFIGTRWLKKLLR